MRVGGVCNSWSFLACPSGSDMEILTDYEYYYVPMALALIVSNCNPISSVIYMQGDGARDNDLAIIQLRTPIPDHLRSPSLSIACLKHPSIPLPDTGIIIAWGQAYLGAFPAFHLQQAPVGLNQTLAREERAACKCGDLGFETP